MANETTKTTLTELTQELIAEARFVASQGVDLTQFTTKRQLPMGKSSVEFPIYDEQVLASVSEATDLTNTAQQTTSATVTPGEYGLMSTITDVAEFVSNSNIRADIARVMGEGYRAARNRAMYALFDGFSNQVGTTNTDVTEANIREAVRVLRINKAPGPYYMSVTPHTLEDALSLYGTADNTTSVNVRNQVVETGTLPPIHGVIPVLVDNLAVGTSAGEINEADTKGGIWSPAAIGDVVAWDFRIEFQRDASMRGTEMVATANFGLGEIRDGYGVELLTDNAD